MRYVLETTDGEYRCQALVLAVGVAEPWTPSRARHRARPPLRRDARAPSVRGQADLHPGQAELGVRARVGPVGLGVADRRRLAVARQVVGPDAVAGRGPGALCAAVRGPLPRAGRVDPRRRRSTAIDPDGGRPARRAQAHRHAGCRSIEVDEVIAATGFMCPLRDLPALGVADLRPEQPAVRHAVLGERDAARDPLRGHHRPGVGGLKKHGIPSNSGAVHGARYNARILARHVAESTSGSSPRAAHRGGATCSAICSTRRRGGRSCGTRRRTSRASRSRRPRSASATWASCRWPTSLDAGDPTPSR